MPIFVSRVGGRVPASPPDGSRAALGEACLTVPGAINAQLRQGIRADRLGRDLAALHALFDEAGHPTPAALNPKPGAGIVADAGLRYLAAGHLLPREARGPAPPR